MATVAPSGVPLRGRIGRLPKSIGGRLPAVLVVAAAGVGFVSLVPGGSTASLSTRGYAEAIDRPVAALRAGRLASLRVRVGQHVRAGQVLAALDPRELDARRERLNAEMGQLEARLLAERNVQDLDVMRGELLALRVRASEREDRAELRELTTQMNRLDGLASQQLVRATEVEDARRKREALAARVATYDKALENGQAGLGEKGVRGAPGHAVAVATRLAPFREALKVQEAELHEIKIQLADLTLRAPADGTVSSILHRPGDVVPAAQPVLTVVTSRPGVVVATVPERAAGGIDVGTAARVRRPGLWTAWSDGRVIEVAPEMEEIPIRARPSPGVPAWGRRVVIEVASVEPLLPGETFHVRL